ncbi:MAG TPA: hypothetical protein VFA45_05725 [Actinomycetes bacterium]|nr:hypothetical protein [Actinomycetes bacterium]
MAHRDLQRWGPPSGRGIALGALLILGIVLAGCGSEEPAATAVRQTDPPATTAVATTPPTTAAPATSPPTTRRATSTTRKPTPTTRRPPTTRKPPQTTSAPTRNCDPAYPDACLHDGIGDYDCAGGSGNGPNYVEGPITVRAPDPFDLDRDGDGVGCES